MKSDLDTLMETNHFDAILITGAVQHNPAMYYLTGGAHVTSADLIKKRGEAPVLFHNPMEREEAAKTGLITKNLGDFQLGELVKQCNGDYLQGVILRYQKILTELGLTSGRLGLYGKIDAGVAFAIFTGLQRLMPELNIVGEYDDSLLLQAMATKSMEEIERIRQIGQITVAVVDQVVKFLTSHPVKGDRLIKKDGSPLIISDVKSRINFWLAERGAENPEGVIFSIGRDAGIPHSAGNDSDPICLGQTIVFDIFPCEAGGGYFYDFTRTWCLGYAPIETLKVYEDVLAIYRQMMSELKSDTACHDYQKRTCALFEKRGHPTIQTNEQTKEGYVHSIGHGLGLHIHERPWFGKNATNLDRLSPGSVFTIEPGLYYPDKGIGVRLEDSVWIRPDGQPEIFAEYPLDLVLKMKNSDANN